MQTGAALAIVAWPRVNKGAQTMADHEKAAQFLWGLLDDIDTAGDIAKSDDKTYRDIVERLQRRRFEVGSTDGHTVTFQ
jgi:hypothetical protein